jgi:hypothetical protein
MRADHATAVDYTITRPDAENLRGIVLLPADIRQMALKKYVERHGVGDLIALFSQFIGLANSVVANNREMVEIILITEGGMWPNSAEQANLPTIFGALNGVVIADGIDQSKLCEGCAFRVGTSANQSPVTTCDADWQSHPGNANFMCHMDMDNEGQPKKACAGFAQLRAARNK